MLSKIKGSIKPAYMKLYSFINSVYFPFFFKKLHKELLSRNEFCTELPGENILILAPHIDDEVIGCGGAAIKYKIKGKQVFICYLTDSGKRGSGTDAVEIIKERKSEALNIAEKLHIPPQNLFFLSCSDGNLINEDVKNNLYEVISSIKPDVIFVPCIIDTHMDHYAATVKLLEVYGKDKDILENTTLYLYESQSPLTQFYSNVCLQITDVITEKEKLLSLYKSQKTDFKFVIELNKVNGWAFEKNMFCECFIKTSFKKYNQFCSEYLNTIDKYLLIKEKLLLNINESYLIKSYKSSLKNKDILKKL